MLFREIIAVYSDRIILNLCTQQYMPCGQNAGFFNVKAVGTYIKYCVSKD
jgi:hypothetical protein